MGAVLHFMSDRMEAPACGAQVFLCSDYTDDVRHVDCKRCRRTAAFKGFDPTRYDVDIWNPEGDNAIMRMSLFHAYPVITQRD